MKGKLRKISFIPLLMAILLLMGMRSVPHHHCESLPHESAIHLGFGHCDDCSDCHDGCKTGSHRHEECIVWDGSIIHLPGDGKFTSHIKILQQPQLFCVVQQATLPAAPLQQCCWCEPYLFKHTSAVLVSAALRAPPFA